MLQDTEWAYSGEVPSNDYIEPEAGYQYLQIKKVELNEETTEYKIDLFSLSNEAYFKVRYWLSQVDNATGTLVPDPKARRVLISLKKALYGPEANGIPNPVDIVGCAVLAEVKLSPSKKDPTKMFARIYDYKPVPEDIAISYGNPDQFSVAEEPEDDSAASGDREE